MDRLTNLIDRARSNLENARGEIRDFTLNILEDHWYDNLSNIVDDAVSRGYVASEWIDFWGVGSIDPPTTIKWAYDVIRNQGMEEMIEPYYNNVNHRLGIVLKRDVLEEKNMLERGNFLTLPLELRKK